MAPLKDSRALCAKPYFLMSRLMSALKSVHLGGVGRKAPVNTYASNFANTNPNLLAKKLVIVRRWANVRELFYILHTLKKY
mmetsp:Transcript_16752/g.23435  ORF Transcript_16752/g.23435 Transcript_16752/m.23435 type:complete len:81 (-) Transcript_16752:135-377(-)